MLDLSPYLNRIDILNETAQQAIKDFGMNGTEINFFGNTENAYEELFSQILPLVEKLVNEKNSPLLRRGVGPTKGTDSVSHRRGEAFYNLMYRIDISESQIKKAIEESKDKSFSAVVTDLILKRELLKVITRRSFSK